MQTLPQDFLMAADSSHTTHRRLGQVMETTVFRSEFQCNTTAEKASFGQAVGVQ